MCSIALWSKKTTIEHLAWESCLKLKGLECLTNGASILPKMEETRPVKLSYPHSAAGLGLAALAKPTTTAFNQYSYFNNKANFSLEHQFCQFCFPKIIFAVLFKENN